MRCVKGKYKNKFFYINVCSQGEIIGSSSDPEVTLQIDEADLDPKHCKIMYKYKKDIGYKYALTDLKSKTGKSLCRCLFFQL